jgi:hypothetical protein
MPRPTSQPASRPRLAITAAACALHACTWAGGRGAARRGGARSSGSHRLDAPPTCSAARRTPSLALPARLIGCSRAAGQGVGAPPQQAAAAGAARISSRKQSISAASLCEAVSCDKAHGQPQPAGSADGKSCAWRHICTLHLRSHSGSDGGAGEARPARAAAASNAQQHERVTGRPSEDEEKHEGLHFAVRGTREAAAAGAGRTACSMLSCTRLIGARRGREGAAAGVAVPTSGGAPRQARERQRPKGTRGAADGAAPWERIAAQTRCHAATLHLARRRHLDGTTAASSLSGCAAQPA